jgi:MFS family permease
MGVGFGAVLSTLVNTILTSVLSDNQMMQWGWRLPFILGGVLGLLGFLVRRKVEETPVFLKQRPINTQIQWQAVKAHRFQFLRGFGIMLLPASMVTFGLFLPAFVEENFRYTEKQAFSALLLSFIVTSFLLPLIGYCSDKVGRKLLLSLGIILTLICLLPLFDLLKLDHDWALILFMLGYHLLIVLMAGCYPCLLTELFATPIRYTGVTLCYMGCYSFAGLVPFIIMSLYKYSLRPEFAVVLVLFICGMISIVSLARAPVLKALSDEAI